MKRTCTDKSMRVYLACVASGSCRFFIVIFFPFVVRKVRDSGARKLNWPRTKPPHPHPKIQNTRKNSQVHRLEYISLLQAVR